MCEYCDNHVGNESLYKQDYIVCGLKNDVEVFISNKKLTVDTTVNNGDTRVNFDINYCFMCGRKLKEEE